MDTPLVPESVRSASTDQPSTLKGALEKLDIVAFTPESVAEYKQDKIEQMTRQLSHPQGEEISRHDFDPWEYAELNSLRNKVRRKAYLIRLWGKLWQRKSRAICLVIHLSFAFGRCRETSGCASSCSG
jgi:hypothetical protein